MYSCYQVVMTTTAHTTLDLVILGSAVVLCWVILYRGLCLDREEEEGRGEGGKMRELKLEGLTVERRMEKFQISKYVNKSEKVRKVMI